MITIMYNGRLGNRMFQFAAAFLLHLKTGYKICELNSFGKRIFSDQMGKFLERRSFFAELTKKPWQFPETKINIKTTSELYIAMNYPRENVNYIIDGYFIADTDLPPEEQMIIKYRDIIKALYKMEHFKRGINQVGCPEWKTERFDNLRDAFIHFRLGDTLNFKNNPRKLGVPQPYSSLSYLRKILDKKRYSYRKVFIGSDTIDYPPLRDIIDEYTLMPYTHSPVGTIYFAKDFKHLILSHGTFSFWMAYLSDAHQIDAYRSPLKQGLNYEKYVWSFRKDIQLHSDDEEDLPPNL